MSKIFMLLLTFSSLNLQAALAPRMYSFIAQVNGTVSQTQDVHENVAYDNKLSFEILYLVRGGPTFGGRYLIEARNELESNSGQAYGPMAGYYFESGMFVLVGYDILAKLGRWTNGEGFNVNVGYLEHIGSQLHLGAQYSYKSIRYKTDISDNTAVNKDVTDNYPSLTLMYLF